MSNHTEFVNGFVKQCQAHGISDPDVITRLLQEATGDLQVKVACDQLLSDRDVITGFAEKCATVGIVEPSQVEQLLKFAAKAMKDSKKMYKNDYKKVPKGKTHLARY